MHDVYAHAELDRNSRSMPVAMMRAPAPRDRCPEFEFDRTCNLNCVYVYVRIEVLTSVCIFAAAAGHAYELHMQC